jgi:hypothetical protein
MKYRLFFALFLVLFSVSGLSYSGTPEIIDVEVPGEVAVDEGTEFGVDVFHQNDTIYDLSLRVEDLDRGTFYGGRNSMISPNQTTRLTTEFTVQSPSSALPVNEKKYSLHIYGKASGGDRKRWDTRNLTVELRNRPEEFMELDEGWNMISSSEAFKISELSEDCDVTEFRGERLWAAGNSSWTHGETVLGSRGYYVKVERGCIAEIDEFADEDSERSLYKGWNLVSVMEPASLEDVAGDCSFREYSGEAVWHYDSGNWSNPSTSAELDPGKGYFVNAKNSCEMGGATPPVPE